MSDFGTKRSFYAPGRMSAFGGKADIVDLHSDAHHGPTAVLADSLYRGLRWVRTSLEACVQAADSNLETGTVSWGRAHSGQA